MADLEPELDPVAEVQPEERRVLNASLDFLHAMPAAVRNSFDGMPAKVLLREGEIIYRFLENGFTGSAEGFWLPADTYHRLRMDSLTGGIPLPDWAVTQSIALPSKPHPVMFVQATLVQSVFAFRGFLVNPGHQPRLRLWIPGLTGEQIFVRCYNL